MNFSLSKPLPFLLLTLLCLSIVGCVPPQYVRVVPAPVRSFPEPTPGIVRLPVVINFPQGGNVVQAVTNLFKDGIKQVAETLFLKSKMKDLWAKMQSPIFLDKGLYLFIQPQMMSVGNMSTQDENGTTHRAVLEMTASPRLIFGPKPMPFNNPMPPLAPFQPGPPGFEATSNTYMSYSEANHYLADPRMKINGTVLTDSKNWNVILRRVRLYGSGGQIIVEVKLSYQPIPFNLNSKPARLTLYLRGTPHYVPGKRVFDMPDLDYDIKSSDLILQVASSLFKSDFRDQMRKTVKFPVGTKMDILKAKIDKALNRSFGPYLNLKTTVTSFDVLDGYADNKGIEMRLAIKGTATLEMDWK